MKWVKDDVPIIYRNHSIDLQCKLTKWFLQDGNFKLKWVNDKNDNYSVQRYT